MTDPSGQRAVVEFLATAAFAGAAVERITTHISELFLIGARAYKLKRAVRFPYVDFTTVEQRRAACLAEVEINRRTAPELYLGVAPIVRTAEGLTLGALDAAPPDAVDWVVVMRRFDQSQLFDRMAARGELTAPLIDALTDRIATFHRAAAPRPGAGGARALRALLDASLAELGAVDAAVAAPDRVATLAQRARAALDGAAAVLDRRAAAGRVRHCHGDLHLSNICLIDGRPTLFDAIEFSDDIAVIDVLYDLAFLVMDLLHRRLPELANQVVNRYLERLDEIDGLPAFGFLLALRAIVRAKIAATRATETTGSARAEQCREAGSLLTLALDCLTPGTARLVALGGLSGTGKTSVARRLAPALGGPVGAVIVRSDVVRKQLAGVAAEARLDEAAYAPARTAQVYDAMRHRAALALGAGFSVVLDAVHARPEERAAAAALAARLGVAFRGVWLDADVDRLVARVDARADDASDATAAIVHRQVGYATGTIEWATVDASGTLDETAARVRAALG
ncbi:MAG TPA: AAA family ATPase [Candidatus Sulfotelmatobacter sp.]|nr:AAA family ATPase [Candidatus Sulfotelmatobacter sp.]